MINARCLPGLKNLSQVNNILNVKTRPNRIIAVVCDYFKISELDIMATTKLQKILLPRQVAMYLMHKCCSITLREIGSYFGKDHTSVIHSRKIIQGFIDVDPEFRTQIQDIHMMLVAQNVLEIQNISI